MDLLPAALTPPLGLGRLRFLRELSQGHWVAAAAVLAVVLLLIYWPRLLAWIGSRRS